MCWIANTIIHGCVWKGCIPPNRCFERKYDDGPRDLYTSTLYLIFGQPQMGDSISTRGYKTSNRWLRLVTGYDVLYAIWNNISDHMMLVCVELGEPCLNFMPTHGENVDLIHGVSAIWHFRLGFPHFGGFLGTNPEYGEPKKQFIYGPILLGIRSLVVSQVKKIHPNRMILLADWCLRDSLNPPVFFHWKKDLWIDCSRLEFLMPIAL